MRRFRKTIGWILLAVSLPAALAARGLAQDTEGKDFIDPHRVHTAEDAWSPRLFLISMAMLALGCYMVSDNPRRMLESLVKAIRSAGGLLRLVCEALIRAAIRSVQPIPADGPHARERKARRAALIRMPLFLGLFGGIGASLG